MSWVDRLLPRIRKSDNKEENKSKKENAIPEGLWTKCSNCEQVLYTEELQSSLNVCPKCGHHMRLSARQRVEWFLDAQDQVELTQEVVGADPLKFVDSQPYPDRVAAAQRKSKETDALVVKRGTLRGLPVVVAAFEFGFMGGSMGSVVGERFVRGVAEATRLRCPFICFAASGGARMQEGLLSLMQMAKTTAAIAAFSEEKLLDNFVKLGLEKELLGKRLHEISGGQCRRILLAITAMQEKPLLIIDEPTAGLDHTSALKTLQFVQQLCNEGHTVLAVSHDKQFMEGCTRIVTIDN